MSRNIYKCKFLRYPYKVVLIHQTQVSVIFNEDIWQIIIFSSCKPAPHFSHDLKLKHYFAKIAYSLSNSFVDFNASRAACMLFLPINKCIVDNDNG